jgi:O6-methylguanine-DNA--protein-cysteine methyltransferase
LSAVRLQRADKFAVSFEGTEKKSPIVQWFIEYLHGTILPFPYPLDLEHIGPFQREVLE